MLSPNMLTMYSQVVMVEGISVGGRNMNNTRLADDTVLIADSEEKLKALVSMQNNECDRKGLKKC